MGDLLSTSTASGTTAMLPGEGPRSWWPGSVGRWLDREDRQPLLVVDSHTAGNPTRIVLAGIDVPEDVQGVDATRQWLRDHADWLRRRLVHEPRGGGLTCAVMPVWGSGSDATGSWDIGAVILEPGSYPPMCGHCVIGFSAVIAELDLLPDLWAADPRNACFRIRMPAGIIQARVHRTDDNALTVSIDNVGSYPVCALTCALPDGREVAADVLWGGDYYFSVDADLLGLSLTRSDSRAALNIGRHLREWVQNRGLRDPLTDELLDVYQVMFYRRLDAQSHTYRTLIVAPPAQIDRSPCGTGTSALISHLVATGRLAPGEELTTFGIVDSPFTSVCSPSADSDRPHMVKPTLNATAHINGFLTIVADRHDPFRDGFEPV